MKEKPKLTNIIVGAGLGGLVHGILLKKSKPNDEVIIYDANRIPGGFCTSFQKTTLHNGDRINYTINVPLITSDFAKGEPIDILLDYMGVKNIKWKIVEKFVQYYPLNKEPLLISKQNFINDLLKFTDSEKEKKALIKFFNFMKKFYNDLFNRSYVDPTFFQILKMLFTIPKSVFTLLFDKSYISLLKKIGIKKDIIREVLCIAEPFFGVSASQASAVGEMMMLQCFLENNAEQPDKGYTFQDLSDNLAERFVELGGKLILNTKVDKIIFEKNKAKGILINNESINADNVILAVAQDRIGDLVDNGKNIRKISHLLKNIKSFVYSNSDYYCYYLIDKKFIEENPRFIEIAYHVYKLKEGMDKTNKKIAIWVPNELYNDKYYLLGVVMFEEDQSKVDNWIELKKEDYVRYKREKNEVAERYLKILNEIEPAFKKRPIIKPVLVLSPASYFSYGSKNPINGFAQTPDNFGVKRMGKILLKNLFISGGASFSAGLWPAIAGGWQSFTASYKKIYKEEIGHHDVLYRP
jgi:hypothetical protein